MLRDFTTSTGYGWVSDIAASHRARIKLSINLNEKFEIRNNDDYSMINYFIYGRSMFFN